MTTERCPRCAGSLLAESEGSHCLRCGFVVYRDDLRGGDPSATSRSTTRALRPPTRVLSMLRDLDAAIEAELADLTRRAAPSEQPACRLGCAACCTFAVGTTTPEAARVAGAVQEMTPSARRETIARLIGWEREWRSFVMREGDTMPLVRHGGEDALLARDVRWNARRKACPFLDLATHACRVYDARPVACRTHHACHVPPDVPPRADGRRTHAPGEGCFTTAADAAIGLPPGVWQLDATLMDRYGAALLNRYDSEGISWEPCVLPVGVLEAGRARYGWTAPTGAVARAPVPTLRSTWPRGGRRAAS